MDMTWKGYDFKIIDELDEDNYIRQRSYRSKSVAITEEGIKLARNILNKYNIKTWSNHRKINCNEQSLQDNCILGVLLFTIIKYRVWLNYWKKPIRAQNCRYEILILYFKNAYQRIIQEIYATTKGIISTYDIFIVTSRHVETVVRIERE